MSTVAESMDQIIYVGIGIFVLILILSLAYQGYATSANSIISTYCKAGTTCTGANDLGMGVAANYTKYAGPLPNTFGGALQLAVFALVFIAIILAIVGALRGGGSMGVSGGFLGR
jgi:hypothetical protein